MSTEKPDFTTTPCSFCNQTSTEDELLVGCDGCKLWFHARCVNFNPADKKPGKKWYCPDKECQKNKKKTKKSVDEPLPVPPETQEKLKAFEEARKRAEAEQEAALILTEKEMEAAIFLEERKLVKERELRERMARKAEALRKKEFELRQAELEAESKRKEEHLKRIQDLEATFREKNASIDKLLKNSSTPLRNPGVKPLTKENVERHEQEKKPGGKQIPAKSAEGSDDSDSKSSSTESSASESSASESSSRKPSSIGGDDEEVSKGGAKSEESTKPGKGEVSKKKPDGLGQHSSGPTKAQRAARQGLTRKLPDFCGKPEEWPLFFAAYQASNEACGYTDVENLVRLQDCLKGKALEEVRGQLILPKSVPRIIAKLRQLYGRPELLLQSHLQKVRKLEPPRADKLATYIPFGNAVEQLCEHIEAAELTAHLVNPILIQELVDKLPDSEKRNWVHYKRKKRDVNLRTFTNFLSKIVEDACEANVSLDYKSDSKAAAGSSGRSRYKEEAALFNHSEAESSTELNEQKQLKPCKLCHRTDHRLWTCDDFKNMLYEDREKFVKRWKLCQRCLNEHGGQCRTKFRCNVGECREPHSPLLHPESRAVGISAHITSTSPVLFRMLPVKVYCGERSLVVLAFLDEGSSLTLIENGLADRLGLLGTKEELTIKWTANITRVEQHSRRTNLWASAIGGSNGEKLLLQSVRTVEKLMLPNQKLNAKEVSAHYKHLREVPVDSYDGRPGMLIGLNNIHAFAPMETKVGTVVDPVAVRCKLGWTVYGPRNEEVAGTSCFLGCHQEETKEKLHAKEKPVPEAKVAEEKKRLGTAEKLDTKKLAQVAEILELDNKGSKKELAQRIFQFLLKQEGDEAEAIDEEKTYQEQDVSVLARGRATAKSSVGRLKRSTSGQEYKDCEEELKFAEVVLRWNDSEYNSTATSESDAGKRQALHALTARGNQASVRRFRKNGSEEESERPSDDELKKKAKTPARGRCHPVIISAGSVRDRKRENESDEHEKLLKSTKDKHDNKEAKNSSKTENDSKALIRSSKWFEDQKPLEADDPVVVTNVNNRKSWVRGRVQEVFKGSNGRMRQVNVRTADGKVNGKAVVNLAVMEMHDSKSDVREGSPDVTGWGVATAKMGALSGGVGTAV